MNWAQRFDSWVNYFTGLGTSRDKVQAGRFKPSRWLSDQELSDLFTYKDLAKKLCTLRPSEMLAKGYRVISDNDGFSDSLLNEANELGFDTKLLEAMILSKVFGGSLLVYGFDGLPFDELVSPKSLDWINVFDRRWVSPCDVWDNPLSANFEEPATYQIHRGRSLQGTKVHVSRTERFDGTYTEPEVRLQNDGWGLSILQDANEVLSQFGQSWQAVSHMMLGASEGVFAIKDLVGITGAGGEPALQKRMQILQMSKSVARDVIIDADGESYHRDSLAFQGVASILELFMMRLSAVADIPVTRLFGRSPAGENATGESDLRNFYDSLATEQRNKLKPVLVRFYALLAQSIGKGEVEFDIEFNSLWTAPPKEQAETRKIIAETDEIHHGIGVIAASEIRLSRYRDNSWEDDITLDDEPSVAEGPSTEQLKPTLNVTNTAVGDCHTANEVRLASGSEIWGKSPGQNASDGHLPHPVFIKKQLAIHGFGATDETTDETEGEG